MILLIIILLSVAILSEFCLDWLTKQARWAHLAHSGSKCPHGSRARGKIARSELAQKLVIFGQCGRGVSKAVKDSQNEENINDARGFFVLKHIWLFFPFLVINKSFLVLNEAKYFCFMINYLLTKLVRSRWLDISIVLFSRSLQTSTTSRSIKTRKENPAYIQPSWPNQLGHFFRHVSLAYKQAILWLVHSQSNSWFGYVLRALRGLHAWLICLDQLSEVGQFIIICYFYHFDLIDLARYHLRHLVQQKASAPLREGEWPMLSRNEKIAWKESDERSYTMDLQGVHKIWRYQ